MSKKSDQAAKLLEKVELPHEIPAPLKEGSLLQQGLYAVLLRHMPSAKAEAAVGSLAKAFEDWNELRVCQAQEVAAHLAPKGSRTPDKLRKLVPAANAVRDYLQEVYQKTHALDLAELEEDPLSAGKLVSQMPYLGSVAGSFLLWLAHERTLPVTPGLTRVLDRLGLMARTASPKKARAAMDPLVPGDDPLRFAAGFGLVAERWCHQRNPVCWECPLREDCPHGKKVFKEWKVQQERQEAQRVKEEARRLVQAEKDRAREERERKRAEEARRRQAEKDARAAERKLAAEKKATEKKAADAKAAAKKSAEKKAGSKTADKKGPEKKATDKKVADKKAPEKKTSDKRAAEKKAPDKKAAERRAAPKPADKKAAAKKPATAKAPAKKAAALKAKTGAGKSAPKAAPRKR